MNKTIYIRQGDETYWIRGEALAARRKKALPVLLSDLLRRELMAEATGERPNQTPAELVAQAQDLLAEARAKLEEP